MAQHDTVKVVIYDQGNINSALKKFKRLCESYGIVKEYRKRRAFMKPSLAAKEKSKAADKRKRKNEIKDRSFSSKF